MIAPIEQFIINQVRNIRTALKITSEDLSEIVSTSGSRGLIGNIESERNSAVYTDNNLNLIAKVFSEHAAEINDDTLKKDYTLYDFYPKNILDDLPVEKHIDKIPLRNGPTKALYNYIKKGEMYNTRKSITQITQDINQSENTAYKTTNMTSPVEQAVRRGDLERIHLEEGKVEYLIKKN